MQPTTLTSSLFLLFTILTIPSLAQTTATPANCTVFTASPTYTYLRYSTQSSRISSAIVCPARGNTTQSCALTADGDIQVSFSYNVSSMLHDSFWNQRTGSGLVQPMSFMSNLIRNALGNEGSNFNVSVIGPIDEIVPLQPGTAGYLNFYPLLQCVSGTMSNCTGGIEDGLPIEACAAAVSVDRGTALMNGRTVVMNVSAGDVGQYPNPYENQSSGSGSTGGAIGMSVSWGLLAGLVGAGVAVGGVL